MDDTNYDDDSTSGDDADTPFKLTNRPPPAPPPPPSAEFQATDGSHSAVHVHTCAVVSAPAAAAAAAALLSRDGDATTSAAHPVAAAPDAPAPVGGHRNEMPWFIDVDTPVMPQDAGVAVGEQKESALPVLSRALPGESGPILRFSSLLDSPVADRSLIRRHRGVSDASDSSHGSHHSDGCDDTRAGHDDFDARAPKRRRLHAQAQAPAPPSEDGAVVPTASCGSDSGNATEASVPGQCAQPAQEARSQPLPAWEAAIRWDESSSDSGGESSSSG